MWRSAARRNSSLAIQRRRDFRQRPTLYARKLLDGLTQLTELGRKNFWCEHSCSPVTAVLKVRESFVNGWFEILADRSDCQSPVEPK